MRVAKRIWGFLKREAMLGVSALAACASMLLVPPGAAYLSYIDFRVLGLLFCLMAVVALWRKCALFDVLAQKLLSGRRSARLLTLTLTLLPFFTSMLVTNDVALLTFVPFTVVVLTLTGRTGKLPWVVVLQTLAANLGSMATPVGNPQNLFLYNAFSLSAGQFFSAVLPVAGASLALLVGAALLSDSGSTQVDFPEKAVIRHRRLFLLTAALQLLCLLSVFRLLDYRILTAVTLLSLLLFSRETLREVDYCLLLTFVCFFIFAGNIGTVGAVRDFLTGLLQKNTLLTAALTSQFISNVPAAVLLESFTTNWKGLLLGVDVGGLGTPVASLASLISLKLYARSEGARPGRFLWLFLLSNAAGLLLLLPLASLL